MVLSIATVRDSCNLDSSSRTRSTRTVGIITASGNLFYQRHSCYNCQRESGRSYRPMQRRVVELCRVVLIHTEDAGPKF